MRHNGRVINQESVPNAQAIPYNSECRKRERYVFTRPLSAFVLFQYAYILISLLHRYQRKASQRNGNIYWNSCLWNNFSSFRQLKNEAWVARFLLHPVSLNHILLYVVNDWKSVHEFAIMIHFSKHVKSFANQYLPRWKLKLSCRKKNSTRLFVRFNK